MYLFQSSYTLTDIFAIIIVDNNSIVWDKWQPQSAMKLIVQSCIVKSELSAFKNSGMAANDQSHPLRI